MLFKGKHRPIRIISLSFGCSRRFEVRSTWPGGPHLSQVLHDGDLCLMDGWFQKFFEHRVPKEFVQDWRGRKAETKMKAMWIAW